MLGRDSDRWLSVVFAVGVHAAVFALLMLGWNTHSIPQLVKPTPISVELVKLAEESKQPEPRREPASRPQSQPAPVEQQSEPIREEPPKREDIAAIEEPEAAPKSEPEPEPEPIEPPKNIDELSLSALLAQEDEQRDAQSEEELEASQLNVLIRKIQLQVGSYWSRPPSARNGMLVSLRVQFLPNGEVASITVLESSGDPAFDRSAILALRQSQPHGYLTEFGLNFFNKYFRSIVLNFRPEDLK